MKPFFCFITLFFSIIGYAQTLEELGKKYVAKEYNYVLENALRLESQGTDNLDLKLLIGRVYTDKNQASKALPYLLHVYNNDKDKSYKKAWAANYLGFAYYLLSDPIQSEKYLRDAISLKATETVTRSSKNQYAVLGFSDAYKNFFSKESDHIIFHFHPEYSGNVEAFMELREESFKRINSFFNSSLSKKIDFFVWNSRENLQAATGSGGGFARPEYSLTHSLFDQTPGHEITHVISHYSADISNKSVIINEGTAVYFDQTKGNRIERARKILQTAGTNVSILENWNSRRLDERVLYAVAGAFIEFLVEKEGKAKFLEFFKNQTIENARKVYGVQQFESLVKEFENNINPNNSQANINLQEPSIESLPKLDPTVIKAALEQNPSDQYYKTLILINGKPATKSQMEKTNPAVIKNIQVVKSKDDLRKYSEVELNGIIIITTKE